MAGMDLTDLQDIFAKNKANAVPLDVLAEQQKLARKQKLVDALTSSAFSQTPTQMVGPVAVAQSPLDAIGKVLMGGMAGHQQKGIDESMTAMANDYNQRTRDAIASAMAQPEQQAIASLVSSTLPQANSLGTSMMKQRADRVKGLSDEAAKGLSNAGKVQAATNGTVAGAQTLFDKPLEVDDKKIPIDPTTGKPMQLGAGKIQQTTDPKTGQYLNVNPTTGSVWAADAAPKVSVNANTTVTTKGETKMSEKLGEYSAEGVKNLQNEAVQAKKMLQTLNGMTNALNSGVHTGTTANLAMNLGTLGASLGLNVDRKRLANDASYQALFAGEIATYLTSGGGVGRSLTDADRMMLEKQYPQLVQTPEGQRKIIADLRARSEERIQNYGKAINTLRQKYPDIANFTDIGMAVPDVPKAPSAVAPAAGVQSWEATKKKYGF